MPRPPDRGSSAGPRSCGSSSAADRRPATRRCTRLRTTAIYPSCACCSTGEPTGRRGRPRATRRSTSPRRTNAQRPSVCSAAERARRASMFKRIDHVEIVTEELERAVQFYTDVLGFKVRAREHIDRSTLGVTLDLVYLDLG